MTQKALWLPKIGAEFTLGTHAIPKPGPGEVLVKLEASALNPFDALVQRSGFSTVKKYPAILGQDAAGVVRKLGPGVTTLAVGDAVCFQTSPGNDYASFQEYCLARASLATKIPPNVSFDEAASISVGFAPFAVATYAQRPQGVGLTPPFKRSGLGKYVHQAIVIFGGSSSVGQFAVQLARLSGFSPIVTTASVHNEDLLLDLGATHVVDRHLSHVELIRSIRACAPGSLPYIFDAVSTEETQWAAYELLAPGGTLVVVLDAVVGDKDDGSGKRVLEVMGTFDPASNRPLGAQFAIALTGWLAEGKIQPNHVEVLPGGLNGVPDGLERLENGVSAIKLVVRPSET